MLKSIFKKGLAYFIATLMVLSMLQGAVWAEPTMDESMEGEEENSLTEGEEENSLQEDEEEHSLTESEEENSLPESEKENFLNESEKENSLPEGEGEYSLRVGSKNSEGKIAGNDSVYAWVKRPLAGEEITADEYYISFDYRTPELLETSYVVFDVQQDGKQIAPRLQRRGKQLRIIEPSGTTIYLDNVFTVNKWINFVVKYDNGNVSFYCDGNLLMSAGKPYVYTMAAGARVNQIGPFGDTSSGWYDSYGDFDNFIVVQNGEIIMQEDFNSGLDLEDIGWIMSYSEKVEREGQVICEIKDAIVYTEDGHTPPVLESIDIKVNSSSFKVGDRKKLSDILNITGILSDSTPAVMGMADIQAECSDAGIDTSEHGYVTFKESGDYTLTVAAKLMGVQKSQDVAVNVGGGNSLQPGTEDSLFGYVKKALKNDEAITAEDYYISFDYRNKEMRPNNNYTIWDAGYDDGKSAGINIYHRGTTLRVNGKDMTGKYDFSNWTNLAFHFSDSKLKMIYINGNELNGFTAMELAKGTKLGFVGPLGDTSSSWTDGYAQIDNFMVVQNGIVTTFDTFDDGTALGELGWNCSDNVGYANPAVNCPIPELTEITAEVKNLYYPKGETVSIWEAIDISGMLSSGKPAVMGMSGITAVSSNPEVIAVSRESGIPKLQFLDNGVSDITITCSLYGTEKTALVELIVSDGIYMPGGSLHAGDRSGNCAGQAMRVLKDDEKITADEYFISFDYLYPNGADMYNYYTWYSYDKEGVSGKQQYITPAILQTNAKLQLYCEGINAPIILTDTLKPDVWHNFTFYFKNNLLSVYMDGEPAKLNNDEYWVPRDALKIPSLGWFGDTTQDNTSRGDAYYDNIRVIQVKDGKKVITTNIDFNDKDKALEGLETSGKVGYTNKIKDSPAGELESISLTGRTGFKPETEVPLNDMLSLTGRMTNGQRAIMAFGDTVYSSSNTDIMELIKKDGDNRIWLNFKEEGACTLTAEHTLFDVKKTTGIELIVSNTPIINQIEVVLEHDYLVAGETIEPLFKTSDTFGNTGLSKYKDIKDKTGLKVESLTSSLQINEAEDGISMTGVSKGNAVLRLTYMVGENEFTREKALEIAEINLLEAKPVKTPVYVSDKSNIKLIASLSNEEIRRDLAFGNISYEFSDPSAAEEISGQVLAKKACEGLVVAIKANFGEKPYTAQLTMDINELIPSKTKSTYYTEKKVLNAVNNIEKYDWAEGKRDEAVKAADHFLEYFSYEDLWCNLSSQGLPRSYAVNQQKGCPVCGTAINAYGNYPYKINGDRLDWKLRCPSCGLPFTSEEESLEFPTNDFKAYYLGGLNEYGEFDRELAKKHNDELIAAGEAGNLVNRYVESGLSDEQRNKLLQAGIPEETIERICTDPAWGVDDGWGYIDSENGEKYTFAAYYSHWYSWQDGPIKRGLNSLKDAYLYTGEQKYADAAIIILDRMADIYPDMDVSVYRAQDGFQNGVDGVGKVENSVWECGNVNTFMLAFDAVFPAISTMSEAAVNFLNGKSVCQDKSNPDRIKLNFEDNVLRQVVPAFHKSQIHGNEGMHQQSIVLAAVILDSYPETQDWIYKAFATGGKYEAGNFYKLLINSVDHDGQAYESPFYNAGWLSNWLGVAEALDGYELPDGIPLKDGLVSDPYKNVKFKKMFYGIYPLLLNQMYVANIGDNVQAGAPDISIIRKDELIKAFSKYGDTELAQVIYMLNGNSTIGIKEDIFADAAEAIAESIQAIIEENGPLDMKSKLMSGVGFAVLRDGKAGEVAAGSYRYPFLEMDVTEATAPVGIDYPPTLQFNALKTGDALTAEFNFGGDVSKKYNMTIEKWTTGWWGTYDVYLNDQKISSMSFKGTGAVNETLENITLRTGVNKLRFVCTSESEFKMGVRFLTISEIKEDGQAEKEENSQRELWMTFGKYEQHDHNDALNLGLAAYQLDLLPDLGYPRLADNGNERLHWVNSTLSHNTVVVDGLQQVPDYVGTPRHFDDTDFVKLFDVEADRNYGSTDIYRRTSAMIKIDDKSSYIVDLFRVNGGSKHEFSFHAAEGTVTTEGLELIPQEGTYAGPGTVWGEMPASDISTRNPGYYWLKNVEKDDDPSNQFSVNWNIKDAFGVYGNGIHADTDVHLKLTMLGNYDSVALADGVPPVKPGSPESYRYVVVKNEGSSLGSIFTSVIEPYKGSSNIVSIEEVAVTENGNMVSTNEVRAIKVTLKNDRTDYIVNALDTEKTYRIADLFDFKGFFGAYSEYNGKILRRYLNESNELDATESAAVVTGTVNSFTEELAEKNYIRVTPDQNNVNAEELAGRYIYIENDHVKNAVYEIKSAEEDDDGSLNLYIGDVTAIRAWKNVSDFSQGYVYNISAGQKFRIPLSVLRETQYNLTLEAKKGGRITTGIGGSYKYGDVISLTAKADNGYLFKGWASSSGEGVFTDVSAETTSYIMPAKDVTVTALFELIPDDGDDDDDDDGNGDGDGYDDDEEEEPEKPDDMEKPGKPEESEKPAEGEKPGESEEPEKPGDPEEPKGPSQPQPPEFKDIEKHWAKDIIVKVTKAGLLKGYGDGTVRPDSNATRAEFIALMVRMLGIEAKNTVSFNDVDENAWYAQPLAAAAENSLINGRPDGSFGPYDGITREEAMAIVSRILKKLGVKPVTDEKVIDIFADKDDVSPWAKEYVVNLVGLGIIKGSGGKLNPKERITRAEVCVIIDRIMSDFMSK